MAMPCVLVLLEPAQQQDTCTHVPIEYIIVDVQPLCMTQGFSPCALYKFAGEPSAVWGYEHREAVQTKKDVLSYVCAETVSTTNIGRHME